jgi:hypothetical protein
MSGNRPTRRQGKLEFGEMKSKLLGAATLLCVGTTSAATLSFGGFIAWWRRRQRLRYRKHRLIHLGV